MELHNVEVESTKYPSHFFQFAFLPSACCVYSAKAKIELIKENTGNNAIIEITFR